MTFKNIGTKEAQARRNAYIKADTKQLWECYGTFSRAKAEAYEYCKRVCYEYKGRDLKIVSHNGFMFTAAFECEYQNKPAFVYITKSADTLYC